MAVLGATSLTGCNSIPDFIAAGSRMLFEQSTAPTSWTKDTTSHNNKALRVVTGTAAPGGSTAFSTIFASRAVSGTINPTTAGGSVSQTAASINQTTAGGSISQTAASIDQTTVVGSISQTAVGINQTTAGGSISQTAAGGTVGGTTLATTQIPAHAHPINNYPTTQDSVTSGIYTEGSSIFSASSTATSTGNSGGGQSHAHPFSGSQHTHTFTGTAHAHTSPQHTHTFTGTGHAHISPQHTHTFTGTAHGHTSPQHAHTFTGTAHGHTFTGTALDFAVQYVDLIIASKN
jgi:hypothetical protein